MKGPIEPSFEGDFTFAEAEPFSLEAGGVLSPVTLRYAVYGELNPQRSNAILVCHALSGSARVADWWPEMMSEGRPFDTSRYCVIGINVPGSCYGSTGPTSINPLTGERYAETFPLLTISDIVHAQAVLLDHLGIERLHAVIGGSIGGMQALEWAIRYPSRVSNCIVIAAAPLGALGLALNHLQRDAIRNDPAWLGGRYQIEQPPVSGLALARKIAMCTYKSAELFAERFERLPDRRGDDPFGSMEGRFDVAGYLDYQGELFVRRFDANSYLVLSKAMDLFEVARNSNDEIETLRGIQARTLLVGITSDWLFAEEDVRKLAGKMLEAGVRVSYETLVSAHGHDAFLAEADVLAGLISRQLGGPAPPLDSEALNKETNPSEQHNAALEVYG
jgi:homoserine O-acetyltransferase